MHNERVTSQPATSVTHWPGVSAVMPVRNEERHLAASVNRVLQQEYPGDLEVIMAVGPSTDRTADIAAELAASDDRLVVVDNPAGRTPVAMNLGIAAARHDIVARVDGHGEIADHYIERAVRLLETTGAANVGGIMDAQGEGAFEEAVACAYTTRLGLGGSTFHLKDSAEGPADTVFLGVFRKDALLEVGGFDESMFRAQDWELNYRLRQNGHVVWFSPELRVTYRPRSSLTALVRQMYDTGKWRREVMRRHPETANRRYLAPPVALMGLASGTMAGVVGALGGPKVLRMGFAAPVGYLALIVGGAVIAPEGVSLPARLRLPIVLAATHLSWGAGFLVGLRDRDAPVAPRRARLG